MVPAFVTWQCFRKYDTTYCTRVWCTTTYPLRPSFMYKARLLLNAFDSICKSHVLYFSWIWIYFYTYIVAPTQISYMCTACFASIFARLNSIYVKLNAVDFLMCAWITMCIKLVRYVHVYLTIWCLSLSQYIYLDLYTCHIRGLNAF